MLLTSTLVFIALAARSGMDVVLLIVGRRAILPSQRFATRVRLRFLRWYAIALALIYGVYLITLHR